MPLWWWKIFWGENMYISRLQLRNWRNFTDADIPLEETVYILGPNASGKSNLLDVFCFMRDIVKPKGGGLQEAVHARGGFKKIRSLAARKDPWIELEFDFRNDLESLEQLPDWRYLVRIHQEGKGEQRPVVFKEEVWRKEERLLQRPDEDDEADPERKIQTHLEQITMNSEYREVAHFFSDVRYLHLVPQLLKFPDQISSGRTEFDSFGRGFLEEVAHTHKRTREFRLHTIEGVLVRVIPNLEGLRFIQDEITGRPHLEMLYSHWRPNAGWQREDQFSDGTWRLIAMLWSLLAPHSMILLEEPELSLHNAMVEQIPELLYTIRQKRKKVPGQILVSTHSASMLSNTGIQGAFLMLKPPRTGESVTILSPSKADMAAMQAGLSAADVLIPQTGAMIQRM